MNLKFRKISILVAVIVISIPYMVSAFVLQKDTEIVNNKDVEYNNNEYNEIMEFNFENVEELFAQYSYEHSLNSEKFATEHLSQEEIEKEDNYYPDGTFKRSEEEMQMERLLTKTFEDVANYFGVTKEEVIEMVQFN